MVDKNILKVLRPKETLLEQNAMMTLLWNQNILRCNVFGCTKIPTTILTFNRLVFGMCERHYAEAKISGEVSMSIDFTV